MKQLFIILAASASLAGCATTNPGSSYVTAGISEVDATVLASDAADYLSRPLPPAKTTILLDPPSSSAMDTLSPALMEQLRARGFGVVEAPKKKEAAPADVVPVRYLVSPLEAGVILRLQYQSVEAARYYPRATNGALIGAAPFAVREASQ